MVWPKPTTLSLHNVRLEPLSKDHLDDLIVAVKDGKLYNHWYTSIPEYQYTENVNLLPLAANLKSDYHQTA